MFKKFISILLLFFISSFSYLPAFAEDDGYNTGRTIDAVFKTDLNVNKASKGQVVQFVTSENYKIDGVAIPSGTIFSGEVKHYKKSLWGYRRAKVVIKINKMILPNGKTYNVNAFTKRHVLKGSAMANVGKGIVSFPFALVVGVTGAAVIIVESVSIVGLVLVGPTSYVFGETMGKLTHGVNYNKHAGDEIELKVKSIKTSKK